MFEHIGNVIREALQGMSWVTRIAGYTEPASTTDKGRVAVFPAAKPFKDAPFDKTTGYINMAPDSKQVCIIFVDSDSDIAVKRDGGKWQDVETTVRVVVWYNEQKIVYAGATKDAGIMAEIVEAVSAADFNITGFGGVKATFLNMSASAESIWNKYRLSGKDDGLFMRPYRTFALSFKIKGRFVPSCFTDPIISNADAC